MLVADDDEQLCDYCFQTTSREVDVSGERIWTDLSTDRVRLWDAVDKDCAEGGASCPRVRLRRQPSISVSY